VRTYTHASMGNMGFISPLPPRKLRPVKHLSSLAQHEMYHFSGRLSPGQPDPHPVKWTQKIKSPIS